MRSKILLIKTEARASPYNRSFTVNVLRIALLLTVFLIPLLGANNNFGYEHIKVLFFILSISLIGFIWLIRKPKLKWSSIKVASAVFVLALFAVSGLGIDLRGSFLGNNPYFQGWIVYAYLWLFSLMVSMLGVELRDWATALSISALLVSAIAIKQWIAIYFFSAVIPTYAGRVVSTFGQPNFYAGFLLLVLPFSYLLFKDQGKKLQLLGWGSGLISLVGILVSFSRSAILIALVLLILGLVDQLKIKIKLGLIVFGIIFLSCLTALIFSSGIVENEISKPLQNNNPDLTQESVEKRVYIWPQAFKIALQKPLTGFGLENINQAFSKYFEVIKHLPYEEKLKISPVLINLKELNIDRSHNYLLDLLLFSGISGLLGWLGLVGVMFWKLIQNYHDRNNNVLFFSLIIYLIWVQFQNQSIVQLIYFWLLVGLIDRQS